MTQIRWRRLLLQMVLILLPTLLLGSVLGAVIIDALPTSMDDLGPLWLLDVLPGVLSGLILGWLLTPTRRQVGPYLAAAAVLDVVIMLGLLAVTFAMMATSGREHSPVSPGSLLLPYARLIGSQAVVAGTLWGLKASRLRSATAAEPAVRS